MTGAEFDGVDLDLLADYIGGALIGTPDDERVAALVSDDPVWREAYQRLAPGMATVGAMLRDLPAEPVPDDLAGRLDSLFSSSPVTTLPVREAADDFGGLPPVPAKVLDLEEAQRERAADGRPRRRPRWVAPISVAAAVVAFAGFGLSWISGEGASDSGSGSSESAADADAPMVAMAPAVGEILQSGFDYDRATLTQPSAIAGSKRTFSEAPLIASAEASGDDQASDPLSRLLEPSALAACLEAIARANGDGAVTVDTVDYASYTGIPALIVRFTAANGAWAWAVGADCGTPGSDADTLEELPVR